MKCKLFLVVLMSGFMLVNLQAKTEKDSIAKANKNLDLALVPYLNYNNTLGLGLGAVPMASFRINPQDTISPRSLVGGMGFWTTNHSYMFMVYSQLHFDKDNWRIAAAAGHGNFGFQTYMEEAPYSSGAFIDYNTLATFVMIKGFRKIWGKNYGGLGYSFQNNKTHFDEFDIDSVSKNHNIQFDYTFDSRNNVYYPSQGAHANVVWNLAPKTSYNSEIFNTVRSYYNHYFSFQKGKGVLAARAYANVGIGKIDFQHQVTIGNNDLRGYSSGKYRGDGVMDIQGEYRWNVYKRVTLVGFAGVATLYGSSNEDFNWKLYPAAGGGFRYLVFPKMHMNVGIDAAAGKDDWGMYFRIGEAF